jgi:hypothetical protein
VGVVEVAVGCVVTRCHHSTLPLLHQRTAALLPLLLLLLHHNMKPAVFSCC